MELAKMGLWRTAALCISVLALGTPGTTLSAQNAPAKPPKTQATDQTSHLTIEVSGGDKETPIENASVYVKYIDEKTIMKGKKLELNVKTNQDGTAHVPSAPLGRVLIQVVADGWKPYGRWYDIAEAKHTFKIHLDRPPKWY
jgi:hypothetical protein